MITSGALTFAYPGKAALELAHDSEIQVGVDVSSAQGLCDWGRGVARWRGKSGERITFAFCKCTEGNADRADQQFSRNWIEIARAISVRGAYHFAHPDSVHALDAKDEARRFVAQLTRAGGWRRGQDLLALDIEEARNVHKGPEFTRWVLDFCEEVDRLTGIVCGIYTGGPFFSSESGKVDELLLARLRKRWLWIAAYVRDPKHYADMLAEWAGTWVFHQATGDVAPPGEEVLHVDGINTWSERNVDKDFFRGTLSDLIAFAASAVVDAASPANQVVDGGVQLGDPSAPANPLGWADRAEAAASADADETWDSAKGTEPPPTR